MSELSHSAHSQDLPVPDEIAPDAFSGEPGQTEAVALADSPGGRLSEARKARGLTISDVAQAIKFSPRQIEAIENNDLDKLAGANFSRGFMRSYAKFLHIDPQPLLAMLDQQSPQTDAMLHAPQNTGAALPQAWKKHTHVPYLLLLALLVTIIAAAYFIWPPEKSISLTWRGAAIPATVVAQPAAVPVEPAPVVPGPGLQSVPGMQDAPAVPVASVAQPVQADIPDALAQAARQTDFGQHQLMFTFAGRSWVEVKDASQAIIFAQNNDPGSSQVVSGKPPFALVIGNAPFVQLQYDERQIDLRPYTKVEVARLNLE